VRAVVSLSPYTAHVLIRQNPHETLSVET
jgi:hypothetical protein